MYTADSYHIRQCGTQRYEMSFRIYEVLRNQGLTGVSIAEKIGISRQCVSQTINGKTHNRKVLDALREVGVPEKYLFDPRQAQNEQAKVSAVA